MNERKKCLDVGHIVMASSHISNYDPRTNVAQWIDKIKSYRQADFHMLHVKVAAPIIGCYNKYSNYKVYSTEKSIEPTNGPTHVSSYFTEEQT